MTGKMWRERRRPECDGGGQCGTSVDHSFTLSDDSNQMTSNSRTDLFTRTKKRTKISQQARGQSANVKSYVVTLVLLPGFLLFLSGLCLQSSQAAKFPVEEFLHTSYPRKISDDLYMDPCKSGKLKIYMSF